MSTAARAAGVAGRCARRASRQSSGKRPGVAADEPGEAVGRESAARQRLDRLARDVLARGGGAEPDEAGVRLDPDDHVADARDRILAARSRRAA